MVRLQKKHTKNTAKNKMSFKSVFQTENGFLKNTLNPFNVINKNKTLNLCYINIILN